MAASSFVPDTLFARLMACLGQEDLADHLYLLSSDGVQVPAFRTILACSSKVLRGMLCGEFKEATAGQIALDYSSEALRALVEFSITDDVKCFDGREDEAAARGMVDLFVCAHFLDMPLLQEKAQSLVGSLLKSEKSLACTVFEEAARFGEPTESVKLDALDMIRRFPADTLLPRPGISALGPEPLTEIIRDQEMECEEITFFRALDLWATREHSEDLLGSIAKEERVRIAKSLASAYISFSSIQPTDLIDFVKKSGLVDERVLLEAFQAHALLAQKESKDVQFSKKRKAPRLCGIRVSGAGTNAVNGFYKEDGLFDDFPKYTKKGLWKGHESTFILYRYDELGSQWYMTAAPKGGGIGLYDVDLYSGHFQNRSRLHCRWSIINGEAPPPTCHVES